MTDTFEYLLLNGPAKGARVVVPSAKQTSLVGVGYPGLLTLSARAVAYQEDTP